MDSWLLRGTRDKCGVYCGLGKQRQHQSLHGVFVTARFREIAGYQFKLTRKFISCLSWMQNERYSDLNKLSCVVQWNHPKSCYCCIAVKRSYCVQSSWSFTMIRKTLYIWIKEDGWIYDVAYFDNVGFSRVIYDVTQRVKTTEHTICSKIDGNLSNLFHSWLFKAKSNKISTKKKSLNNFRTHHIFRPK